MTATGKKGVEHDHRRSLPSEKRGTQGWREVKDSANHGGAPTIDEGKRGARRVRRRSKKGAVRAAQRPRPSPAS